MNRHREPITKPIHPALKKRIILYFLGATLFCSTFVGFSVMHRSQVAKQMKPQGIFSKAGLIKKPLDTDSKK